MTREQKINFLLNNLVDMNQPKVHSGEVSAAELANFIAEQRERYNAMSDLQIDNMMLINC